MATAKRFDENGEERGDLALPEDLFGGDVHEQAVYEYVKSYLANQRQGTAKTKERSDVSFSTAKLYRQKGTGRARAGSAKSPTREGGGTVFGPRPRDHRMRLNRTVRRLALRSALSDRAREGGVYVVEDSTLDAPKTKRAATMLGNMGLVGKRVCFVTTREDLVLYRSLRNIQGVDLVHAHQLNAYQILRSDSLVLTESALGRVVEVFGS
jgi:large subunit ribosomal protein L4